MTKWKIAIALAGVAMLTLLIGFAGLQAFPLHAAAASASNNPSQAASAPVKASDPGVTPPVVVYKPDPAYTKEAKAAKIQGSVLLMVTVGADGKVMNATVQRSLDPGLDQSAVNAIMTWKFKPATKGGKPVACKATVEVTYKLF